METILKKKFDLMPENLASEFELVMNGTGRFGPLYQE